MIMMRVKVKKSKKIRCNCERVNDWRELSDNWSKDACEMGCKYGV